MASRLYSTIVQIELRSPIFLAEAGVGLDAGRNEVRKPSDW